MLLYSVKQTKAGYIVIIKWGNKMHTNQTTITEANYRAIPPVYIRLIYLFLMLLAWFSAGLGLVCGDLILTALASSAIISIVIHYSLVYKN